MRWTGEKDGPQEGNWSGHDIAGSMRFSPLPLTSEKTLPRTTVHDAIRADLERTSQNSVQKRSEKAHEMPGTWLHEAPFGPLWPLSSDQLLPPNATRSSIPTVSGSTGPGSPREGSKRKTGLRSWEGISEGTRLNDDQIIVSGWPQYIPQMGDLFVAQMED